MSENITIEVIDSNPPPSYGFNNIIVEVKRNGKSLKLVLPENFDNEWLHPDDTHGLNMVSQGHYFYQD